MTTEYITINSGSNGFGMTYPKGATKQILNITHNAGFFSCCTIALQDIVIYFRKHKGLPDHVDRSMQYAHYKNEPLQNLIPFYFEEKDTDINFDEWFEITHDARELQFSDYRKLDFAAAKPFIDKFFTPSQHVLDIVRHYEEKYQIDYEKTCGVLYRGNDKHREAKIAPYEAFIDKTIKVTREHVAGSNTLNYFVLPDEPEFMEAFRVGILPYATTPDELPMCDKKDSAMFLELPLSERAEYGAKFMAAILVISKCKHIVTHSGNISMWAVLYRGNVNGVHQWQDDKWIY